MKICMLAPEFLPVWGGVGTYIVELVEHLSKDVEFHVVTPIREGFDSDGMSTLEYNFSEYFRSNVHIHFVSRARDTFIYNARFQYACLKAVPKLIKEERIDLLHSHTAHMPDLFLMFRKLNKPIVTTVHTTIKSQRLSTKASKRGFHELEASEKGTFVTYPVLRLLEELYFRRRRFYITPSNWMKKWLEGNFRIKERIRVLPNSLEINKDKPKRRDAIIEEVIPRELRNRRMILYVGRLLSLKGVDVLIDSISEILRASGTDDLLFIFTGPGDSVKYIKRLKEMGIDDSWVFTGPLPRKKVIQLLMSVDILVLPSFLENTPYVILEAMACGVPVIATNVGGIPEIIEDGQNGLLVTPGSSKALVSSILMLLEDASLHNRIRQNGERTIAAKYSWSVNAEKYVKAYEECINA